MNTILNIFADKRVFVRGLADRNRDIKDSIETNP